MGVRIFVSGNCGNQKIETEQQKIFLVLQTRKIEFEAIDIMHPGNQKLRTFMREKGKKKEGARNVIPPQIFNGEEFRGDFDDFDIANEDDLLEEFLGLERKNPKAAPVKTGATAPEIKKLSVGKLPKNENINKNVENERDSCQEDSNIADMSSVTGDKDTAVDRDEEQGKDSIEINSSDVLTENTEIGGDSVTVSDSDSGSDSSSDGEEKATEGNDSGIEMLDERGKGDNERLENGDISDCDHDIEENGGEKDNDSYVNVDNFTDKNNDADNLVENNDSSKNFADDKSDEIVKDVSDYETDSDDFTDSEDDTVEFMPDGELVRKSKPGFKQLNNCKRFWKVTNNIS